jgi:hypothetical protein
VLHNGTAKCDFWSHFFTGLTVLGVALPIYFLRIIRRVLPLIKYFILQHFSDLLCNYIMYSKSFLIFRFEPLRPGRTIQCALSSAKLFYCNSGVCDVWKRGYEVYGNPRGFYSKFFSVSKIQTLQYSAIYWQVTVIKVPLLITNIFPCNRVLDTVSFWGSSFCHFKMLIKRPPFSRNSLTNAFI